MSDFDAFWEKYPRKVAKLEAVKAWKQMTRDYPASEIIAGLDRNLPSLKAKERQFIKHPASWLRAGCWMDEPDQQTRRPGDMADFGREALERFHGRTFLSSSDH